MAHRDLQRVDLVSDLGYSEEGIVDWTLDLFVSPINRKKLDKFKENVESLEATIIEDKSRKTFKERNKYRPESFLCLIKNEEFVRNPDREMAQSVSDFKTMVSVFKNAFEELKLDGDIRGRTLRPAEELNFLGGLTTERTLIGRRKNKKGSKVLEKHEQVNNVIITNRVDLAELLVYLGIIIVSEVQSARYKKKYRETLKKANRSLRLSSINFPKGFADIGKELSKLVEVMKEFRDFYEDNRSSDRSGLRKGLRTLNSLANTIFYLTENFAQLKLGFEEI